MLNGAATLGALKTSNLFAQSSNTADSSRRVLHIFGHSHIDAAWLWPWRDSYNVVFNTFRSALDRMNETPAFHFSHSSSMHYRWVQKADPALFDEICHRVRQGRWEVVGGWPVEPDCTIPSTESFVRHSLYGKRFCSSALGVNVKIGFNPDSFGHAYGLPTIFKNAGYNYYVFMKPQEQDMTLPLLFWWEGPDGSRVLALRILHSYDNPADRIPTVANASFAPGFTHGAFFLGVGDHGGAVTKAQIQDVLKLQQDSSLPELRFSTLQQFFSAVESSPAMATLPVIKGDLERNRRGTYSACAEEKYNNRRAERAMFASESLSVLTAARPYPRAGFETAWWNILFNQFHDLLAGTALYADYENSRDDVGAACHTANAQKLESLEVIAKQVDTTHAPAGVVFAFNTMPWPRKALLEYHSNSAHTVNVTHLQAQDGTLTPVQLRPSDGMTTSRPRVNALIDLPPFGYKVFNEVLQTPAPTASFSSFATIADSAFGLASLKAQDGTELLAANLGLVVISDNSDTWGRERTSFRQEIGRPKLIFSQLVEEGPVLRVTRQILTWQNSRIGVEFTNFVGLDIVRMYFVIDWNEHQQTLKLEIPTVLNDPRVFAMVPGAVIEKPVNGYEEPYQDWIALQGTLNGAPYTVGLMNNCTYSYDCLNGNLRTVLIRSAPYSLELHLPVTNNDLRPWQDQGRQERTFWLTGRQGEYSTLALDRLANELQSNAEYVLDSRHSGTRPWQDSFFEVTPSSISVLSIKQAEDSSDAFIVRLQERSGQTSKAHLHSKLLNLDHDIPLAPWEIKTLRIHKSQTPQIHPVSLLEI